MPAAMLSTQRLGVLQAAYRDAVRARRRSWGVFAAVLVTLVLVTTWVGEVNLATLAANAWRLPDFVGRTLPELTWANLGADLAEWFWGTSRWLRLLWETLLIAYAGTVFGAAGAFLLCFLAAANLMPSRALVFGARRAMEICRTVPELVFALTFVIAFGLGPLPGVLALVIHTMGALGKLFAEVVENIDMGPVEGLKSTGSSLTQVIRHGVVPQVLRGAAIMGFVGAGGIGQELLEAVRKFYYTDISAIILLIAATVMLIDMASERLRHRLFDLQVIR